MDESQSIVDAYLSYFEDGVLGLSATIDEHQITLYQETDEDEEESKYRIIREEVVSADWDQLVAHLRAMD